MNLTYPDGTTTNVSALAFYNHPYNPGYSGALVDYIDEYGSGGFTTFSETEAKAAGGQLGPDLVKYLLRSSNPSTTFGGNTLGSSFSDFTGP